MTDEKVAAKPIFNAGGYHIGYKRVCQHCKGDLPLDYAGGPWHHDFMVYCSEKCLAAHKTFPKDQCVRCGATVSDCCGTYVTDERCSTCGDSQ